MAFSSVIATEALFSMQGITSVHEKSRVGKVLGKPVLFDPKLNAVLICVGTDHSTYPDMQYLLLLGGVAVNIWKNFDQLRKKSSVVVYLNAEVEHLEDSFFVSLLKPVLCIATDDEDPIIGISVIGRKEPPAPPRSPKELVAYLNRFGKVSTREARRVAADMFVPGLVKPHEVAAFVEHIDLAGFDQLKPQMRSIVEQVFPMLRNRVLLSKHKT